MSKSFTKLSLVLLAGSFLSATASAGGRPDGSSRSWFGQINTGWAFANGDSGDFLDDDWTLGAGAMYWPSDWPVGIGFDVNYWKTDLSSNAIRAINDLIDKYRDALLLVAYGNDDVDAYHVPQRRDVTGVGICAAIVP